MTSLPDEAVKALDAARLREVEREEAADGAACGWRSCTGCHESDEGVPQGPYSPLFQAHLGMGCGECGGLGVVWEYWPKEALDAMQREVYDRLKATPEAGAGGVVVPRAALEEVRDLLIERRHGNPARSPAHNARLIVDGLLDAPSAPTAQAETEGGEAGAWSRDDLAKGLAALDGIRLLDVKATVGPENDAGNWREYLGRADDLMAHLSFAIDTSFDWNNPNGLSEDELDGSALTKPVAYAYIVNGECEQLSWGTDPELPDDLALTWLFLQPARSTRTVTDDMARALVRKHREIYPGAGWPTLEDARALLSAALFLSTLPTSERVAAPAGEAGNCELLRDANSHYSAAQLEEIGRNRTEAWGWYHPVYGLVRDINEKAKRPNDDQFIALFLHPAPASDDDRIAELTAALDRAADRMHKAEACEAKLERMVEHLGGLADERFDACRNWQDRATTAERRLGEPSEREKALEAEHPQIEEAINFIVALKPHKSRFILERLLAARAALGERAG